MVEPSNEQMERAWELYDDIGKTVLDGNGDRVCGTDAAMIAEALDAAEKRGANDAIDGAYEMWAKGFTDGHAKAEAEKRARLAGFIAEFEALIVEDPDRSAHYQTCIDDMRVFLGEHTAPEAADED